MRKIVVHMMLSLDGYFEGPDHDLSWHLVDEELHAHFNEQLATNGAFMEGRVTYELMEAFWPTADQNPDYPPTMREFAGIWRAVPKIVFSRTLQEVGPNASLRAGVDPDEIRALKQQPGGDMTLGGVDLVKTFRRLDLVDEFRLYVNPVLVGRGRRLFETADNPTDLKLLENRRFGNGVVLLRYATPSGSWQTQADPCRSTGSEASNASQESNPGRAGGSTYPSVAFQDSATARGAAQSKVTCTCSKPGMDAA